MPHHHSKLLHVANSLPCLNTIHPHRMLYHGNLLHKHLNHFSSLLSCSSNSSHCFNHQLLHHRLQTCSMASCHSYNPGLVLKANILGNKGTHPPLCKILILLHSLSFQLWRDNNSLPNTQEPRVPKLADGKGVKKQLSNRQGVLPMQTTRTPQERLPRATILLQM